jgi:RND superfamily putative drug exporter
VTGLARLALRRRRRIVVLGAILFVAGAAFGGPVAGELSAEDADFLDPQAQAVAADERIERATGGRGALGLVALQREQGDVRRDPAARARLRVLQREVGADPGVERTVSWLDTRNPGFVSRDGTQAVVAASFAEGADELEVVDRLRERLGRQGVTFGGRGVINPEIGQTVQEDLARAEMLAFPILFLLSLWVFRGAVAALLPPLIGALSIVTTFLVLRFVDSQLTGLSIFALNLVTGIGLGLAIDYGLFIVSRYREEAARLGFGPEALVRTMQTAGRTVLFSALTVAAAMAALLVFPLRFLYSMGIGGVIVTLVAAAVSLVVLPATLAALGPRVNALSPKRLRRSAEAGARPGTGGWYRLAHGVMRRPGLVAASTALVLLVAGLPFLRVDFVSADFRQLPQGSEARQVSVALERDFGAFAAEPIKVVASATPADDERLAAYAQRLQAIPGAGRVSPPQRLSADTVEIDVLPPGDPLSDPSKAVLDAVRAAPAPVPVALTGVTAHITDQHASLVDGLPLALALLAGTTFVVLFLMTGSVVLPVKALIMNVLTLSATFGILVLVFQDGRLEGLLDFQSPGGLEATQPILLFAIAFGLATDYGVFLLSRIKEARDGGMENREAVAFGVERTGRIVTAAALLFCVAVGAFATSGVVFIKQVGLGTALAVVIDATIIRALLVPALMALLGRWNWWAPRPLRRLHDRIGIDEGGARSAAAQASGIS